MTSTWRLAAATLLLTALAGLGILAAGSSSASGPDTDDGLLGPGRATIELGIEHSAFSTNRIIVQVGTTLTFVVENGDPIGHELIVGPPEVHARHEGGAEASHPPVPGEVTVPALAEASTTYDFDEPGSYEFACHLPGHVAYGMVGEVVVVE